jgi:protein gp37
MKINVILVNHHSTYLDTPVFITVQKDNGLKMIANVNQTMIVDVAQIVITTVKHVSDQLYTNVTGVLKDFMVEFKITMNVDLTVKITNGMMIMIDYVKHVLPHVGNVLVHLMTNVPVVKSHTLKLVPNVLLNLQPLKKICV